MRIRRKRLRELRRLRGLTQAAVAEAVGCSRAAVSMWETRGTTPLLNRLYALAEVLKAPVSEFVDGAQDATLRGLRKSAGMLQRDIARMLHVGTPTYCDVETHRQEIPDRWIPILSKAYGVSAEEIRGLGKQRSRGEN
ncbi:helix-turn-helix transcriptional regulator [Streptomyces sp. NPDC127106]|uniref:helix-turn-helix transcriptional regulator n=1 Tax=Streptomyces sp. NPDC127106 TaxID=3345360 RepID=UPI00362FD405